MVIIFFDFLFLFSFYFFAGLAFGVWRFSVSRVSTICVDGERARAGGQEDRRAGGQEGGVGQLVVKTVDSGLDLDSPSASWWPAGRPTYRTCQRHAQNKRAIIRTISSLALATATAALAAAALNSTDLARISRNLLHLTFRIFSDKLFASDCEDGHGQFGRLCQCAVLSTAFQRRAIDFAHRAAVRESSRREYGSN